MAGPATTSALPNSLASRDIAYHVHPYTNQSTFPSEGPLIVCRGEGVRVFDDSGNAYFDALAGLWCCNLGFGNDERLLKAATRQLTDLPFYHTFAAKTSDTAIKLAEKIISLAPVPMSKVLFANSGSESNDTAIKLMWYYNNALGRPHKKKIISRIKGYHGVTVATASLTGLPNNQRDFDLPIAGILHAGCPHHYRFARPGESEDDFATRCAADLEQLILSEGPDTVAGFFGEPVMAAGGVIVPPASYWPKIQAVLRKYDILLLADEVVCGFGRTGNPWGCQTFGIKPDMITIAKGLSAAYLPISALMISEPIYQAIVEESAKIGVFGHGYTYAGHPAAAAVALETQKIYEDRGVFENARRMAPLLQEALGRFAAHPLVGEKRGIGFIGALEIVKNKATREVFAPADAVAAYVAKRAQAHGVIVRVIGDSIPFCPPLIMEPGELEDMMTRFGRALDEAHDMAKRRKLVA